MKNKIFKNHIHEIIAATIYLLAYVPTLIWMWDRWWARDSYYSHGILIPFVTGFLIWQKREDLASIKKIGSVWGMPLIVTGMIMHIFGSLMRVYFISGFSMLFVLIGLILFFLWGKNI